MALSYETVTAYFRDKLGVDTTDLTPDTPLFSSSLIDSFAMVDVIMFLERESGIRMSPTDVNLDNFDTVGRILRYVEGRAQSSK